MHPDAFDLPIHRAPWPAWVAALALLVGLLTVAFVAHQMLGR